MTAIITTLLAAIVTVGLAGVSATAAAKGRHVYGYAPYAYPPYAYGSYRGSAPWFAYSTYSSGFSPYPYSDGFGAYARPTGYFPRGYGYYGYRPDLDSASGWGPYFGTNPWWRVMDRFGGGGPA